MHQWKGPKFTLSTLNQGYEWKAFYIQAIDFLKAMDIVKEMEDNIKIGWKQLHMMFEGEDYQSLQVFFNNDTITANDHKVLIRVLDTIQITIKEKEHF